MQVKFYLLRRLLGVKTDGEKQGKVTKLKKGEILMATWQAFGAGQPWLNILDVLLRHLDTHGTPEYMYIWFWYLCIKLLPGDSESRKQVMPGGMIGGQYGETHQQTKVNIGSTAAGGRVSWQQLDSTDPDGDSVTGATILSGLFPLTFADFAASLWQRVHLQPLAKD